MKRVYFFADPKLTEGTPDKDLLGGKGAGLTEMCGLGLPVPPGFTISTNVCREFFAQGEKLPEDFWTEVRTQLSRLEEVSGKKFGDVSRPLLVSVRSGAKFSMPGMMDTILNLGMNDKVAAGLAEKSGNPFFAYDSYRRLIQMYGEVVLGINGSLFESELEELKFQRKVKLDSELSAEDLLTLVGVFKGIIFDQKSVRFPEDPWIQLQGAVGAVFRSWNNPRAMTYRQIHKYSDDMGTAVTVQSMVFGNLGNDCATGVAFTRNPSNGEKIYFGEYLKNAQGEDVVAGVRTPQPINEQSKNDANRALPTLEKELPKAYGDLISLFQKLETHFKDMQDVEFTIEGGKLYVLQTRNGKRTAQAAVRVAVDLVKEKVIDKSTALLRVSPEQLDMLLHPTLDPRAEKKVLAKGLPASPGAASGQVVFTPETAEAWVKLGRKVILVRTETSPEDIQGMNVAQGILTSRGGMTSHAAVVARGMGKCCVAGCSAIKVYEARREFQADETTIREGDFITLDGASGEVILGELPTVTPTLDGYFGEFISWADEVRKLRVRANADTPRDAKTAHGFGAEGIGLCRTEHMFFDGDRIDAVREMILSDDYDSRMTALRKILPMQKADFKGIYRELKGCPITIRLLDPPLHEFLPHSDEDIVELGERLNMPFDRLKKKTESLREFNPMLGHRGCRLGISFPEIYRMQTRAIMEAACELVKEEGFSIEPEIMIPLIADWRELKIIRQYVVEESEAVMKKVGTKIPYQVGTMIELPRAALTSAEIAPYADFFSFGTNDLTQTTYGLSRDDAGNFLKHYISAKIFAADPFVSLDQAGVGRLMKISVEDGRKAKPGLKIGICGEHGGETESVRFCHELGLDYVSCSPYRVPIARLAAAQAALRK